MSQSTSARCQSFASTELWVTNGVVASAATATSPVKVLPASMTGALMSGTTGRFLKLARALTITRSSSSGAYSVSPIVIVGTLSGQTQTESLTPANANGGDFMQTVNVYDTITSVSFPAQASTAGAFTIGAGDIGGHSGSDRFGGIELLAAGTVNIQFGAGGPSDAKLCAAFQVVQVAFSRLLTNPALATPTTVGVTLYI